MGNAQQGVHFSRAAWQIIKLFVLSFRGSVG